MSVPRLTALPLPQAASGTDTALQWDAQPGRWSADMDALAPGLIAALLRFLGDRPDEGMLVRLPRQHALLIVRRQTTPSQIMEFVFDPSSGRFDCTACLTLPQRPPPDPSSDAGGLRIALQALTGASTVTLMQAPPLVLEPWNAWSIPPPPTASDTVSLDLDTGATAGRVHRKARL